MIAPIYPNAPLTLIPTDRERRENEKKGPTCIFFKRKGINTPRKSTERVQKKVCGEVATSMSSHSFSKHLITHIIS